MTSDAVAGSPAAVRGRTVIVNRVRERLVERALLGVPGVVAKKTMIPGRSLPAISISDRPVTVDVQIAASWPTDSAALLSATRSAVARELAENLGETAEHVDVTIAKVDSERSPAEVADAYDGQPAGEPIGVQHRRLAPRRASKATFSAVLIAVAVIVLGVIAIRDAWTSTDPWIAPALSWAAELQWQWWAWPAAVVAALLGLALLVAAVTPRRRTHVSVGDHVWIRRGAEKDWNAAETETNPFDSDGEIR